MRLRIAKKILNTHGKNYLKRYRELRQPFKKVINGSERLVYPSWHDLPLIKKASIRLIRKYNKYKYQNNNDEV
ncbi:hypothetical protein DXA50_00320 [Butyricimonas virosa]|uniref:Uncharacterized protein n=1 Tax=Butyricimonas virosa TaxID=544645 RepID=A0A413ITU6_9BACT|nr:hypothetical protein DXA50_00320 [Butyricimonas virosa]